MHLEGKHQARRSGGWLLTWVMSGSLGLVLLCAGGDASAQGMTGYYYNGTGFSELRATRTDPSINFESWPAEVMPENVPTNNFSVRWLGQLRPRYSETYELIVTTDDGMRLWVGEDLLVDRWFGQGATAYPVSIPLRTGLRYNIMIEYYQGGGGGRALFEWVSPSQVREVITDDRLVPMEQPDGDTFVTIYASGPVTGERSTDLGKLAVTRWGGSLDEPLTVPLLVSGDAVAGEDYAPLPETVTIPANRTTVGVNISVLDDTEEEEDKEVIVGLGIGVGYTLGAGSSATVVIEDDDGASGPGLSSIVGMLEHGGTSAGHLVAVAWRDEGLSDEADRAVLVQPGIYSIPGLEAGRYFVSGFLDTNRNGEHDADEPRMEAGPLMLPPDALEVDFDFTPGCDEPNAPASCDEEADVGVGEDAGGDGADGGVSGDAGTAGVDASVGEPGPTAGGSSGDDGGCQQVGGFPGGGSLLWLGLGLGWMVYRRREIPGGC